MTIQRSRWWVSYWAQKAAIVREFSDQRPRWLVIPMMRRLAVSAPGDQDIRDTGHQGLGR